MSRRRSRSNSPLRVDPLSDNPSREKREYAILDALIRGEEKERKPVVAISRDGSRTDAIEDISPYRRYELCNVNEFEMKYSYSRLHDRAVSALKRKCAQYDERIHRPVTYILSAVDRGVDSGKMSVEVQLEFEEEPSNENPARKQFEAWLKDMKRVYKWVVESRTVAWSPPPLPRVRIAYLVDWSAAPPKSAAREIAEAIENAAISTDWIEKGLDNIAEAIANHE